MTVVHTEENIAEAGYVRMDIPPQAELFSFSVMQKLKIHRAFRLPDGLWYAYRLSDSKKAKKMDKDMKGAILPL